MILSIETGESETNTQDLHYRVLENGDKLYKNNRHKFAMDVLTGLSESRKKLPTEYIYDKNGSELFRKIMKLPEYYLTRSETELLRINRNQMREALDNGQLNLIELGAGDGQKTRLLIENFLRNGVEFKYIPIDISESAMDGLIGQFTREFKHLKTEGIVSDYFSGLNWLSNITSRQNLVLFLGSNIGNFSPVKLKRFLSRLWHMLNDGDLVLIGFDLKKDIRIMEAAYDDSQGITADFNLNLLKRINRELAGEFNLNQFKFYSTYDAEAGAIQSYLISQIEQEVYIGDLEKFFHFKAFEAIHTESSYKFSLEDIELLAESNRFDIVEHYFDSNKRFTDSLWRVSKG